MIGALVVIRAVHFGATLLVAGALVFALLIAARDDEDTHLRLGSLVRWGALAGLLSGALWLAVQAAMVSGQASGALDPIILGALIARTQFGQITIVRLLLFAALFTDRWLWRGLRTLRAAIGVALAGSLAWTGHAAAGTGWTGDVHLASDAIHVVAAAAWVGGLVCLADALRRPLTADQAAAMARRFSALGLTTVAGLLASGLINTWFLVGSLGQLVGTGYGRVLMLKMALFVAMVAIAGVNRWHVVPRLAAAEAVSALRRNALVEAAFGMLAVTVVAWLGVQPPAAHMH